MWVRVLIFFSLHCFVFKYAFSSLQISTAAYKIDDVTVHKIMYDFIVGTQCCKENYITRI